MSIAPRLARMKVRDLARGSGRATSNTAVVLRVNSQTGPRVHLDAGGTRLRLRALHVTQDRDFARGLVHFAETGGISQTLKTHLRVHVRTPGYPDQLQAARLLRYCAERGPNVEPISPDFGTTCDQIDRADVMLAALRDRARQGLTSPERAWPETDGPQILALAGRDPDTGAVSLILDATTANIAMHAIAAHADEREAHVREVERYGQTLPEGSYGRQNRQAIAAREIRVAARLRAVERAHRLATERDIMVKPSEPIQARQSPQRQADTDIELG